MIVNTKGIILRTTRYSDTSLIVPILTQELGVKTYFLRGIRKHKTKGNLFQPMQQLDMVVDYRDNKDLQYIKEFKASTIYESIYASMQKTAVGLLMTETLYNATKHIPTDEELYKFIEQSFLQLDHDAFNPDFHLQFLLQLSQYLGFYPNNNFSSTVNIFALQDGFFVSEKDMYSFKLSESDSELFYHFLNQGNLQNSMQRRQLLSILEQYYQMQLTDFRPLLTPTIYSEVL